MKVAQPKTDPAGNHAVRPLAPHVQKAIGSVQPKLPHHPESQAPHVRAALAARKGAVQRAANRDLPKAVKYGSLGLTYTDEELVEAAQQTGWNEGYSGHLSGKSGDSVSGTTLRAQQEIAEQARKNRERAKKSKKKAPIRQEAPKDDTWKAFNKADLLMSEVKKGDKELDAALDEYYQYLDKKLDDELIVETTYDKCMEYWGKLANQ